MIDIIAMSDIDEFEVEYVVGLESLLREYMNMPDTITLADYNRLRNRALEHLGEEEEDGLD